MAGKRKIRSYAVLKCLPLIQLECKRIRLGNLLPDRNILVHQPGNRMVKNLETECNTRLICSCEKAHELSNVVGIVHLRNKKILSDNRFTGMGGSGIA